VTTPLSLTAPGVTIWHNDEPIIQQIKRIGIEPGKDLDIERVSATARRALETVPSMAQRLDQRLPGRQPLAQPDTMGVYGN